MSLLLLCFVFSVSCISAEPSKPDDVSGTVTLLQKFGTWIALAGIAVFVFVLFISAYWEANIRWLHFLQSWMYLASAILIYRKNRWGHLIGLGAAAFWSYTNLFVTTFLKNGIVRLRDLTQTGHISRPDQFVSVPGWFGNFAVILGCCLAYAAITQKHWLDLGRLALATACTTGFFALSVAICQPRYLALFRALLHPHLRL